MTPRSGLPAAVPHRESHLGILAASTAEGVGPVDAVIVPTARGNDRLLPAAHLAKDLDAVLLVLCSVHSQATAVSDALAPVTGLEWYAVDVRADHRHPLLPPVRHHPDVGGRMSLSRKRNLGLLVARMVGWQTVLFLDDDIVDVNADAVRLAAGQLLNAAAVGLAVAEFPDNSVVCHANRLGGGKQTVFVSGSALLVDVHAAELGHFPTVYNEDWLFLFDALAAQRVRREGTARQLNYDPFGRPGRAREEEFGDVVAEGLVAHLERGGSGVPLSPRYWAGFLRRRAAFLDRTAQRLADGPRSPRRAAALRALREADDRCASIRPGEIVGFLREWRRDREEWRTRLDTITPAHGVQAALRRLGLGKAHAGRTEVAVIVPGFLDGPANQAHRLLAKTLRSVGLPTIDFAPRGLPARPGDRFTGSPSAHLDELRDLVDEHVAPNGHVTLIGHCYGGWLSGLYAARDKRVTRLVLLMPTRCFVWSDDYRDGRDTWRRRGEILLSYPEPGETTLSAVRLPHTLVADACRHDLPATLAKLSQPVLFVAGTSDDVVPAASVARLHAECGAAEKELAELPVGHDYRDDAEQTEIVNRCVLGWLGR